MIPRIYACQGGNISPPLRIDGVPPGAKGLALVVDDPDAPNGTWDHWIVWNIAPNTTGIPEGTVPQGAAQGKNSWRKNRYGGPCPPSGTHRYFFKLYALDAELSLSPNSTKLDLEAAMRDHIVGQAQLMGTYRKS